MHNLPQREENNTEIIKEVFQLNQQQQNETFTSSSSMPAQISHGGHELFDSHQAIDGLVGGLEHSVFYEPHIKDPELKELMSRQKNYLTQLYNTIVDTLQTGKEPQIKTQTYNMPYENDTIYGMEASQPKTPAQSINEIDDACISSFMMGHLKTCASHFTMTALEATNPVMRRVFADSVPNLIEMAYEIFLYQNKNKYYQIPQLKEEDAQIYMNSFAKMNGNMQH
jgi:spore coat protein CotF